MHRKEELLADLQLIAKLATEGLALLALDKLDEADLILAEIEDNSRAAAAHAFKRADAARQEAKQLRLDCYRTDAPEGYTTILEYGLKAGHYDDIETDEELVKESFNDYLTLRRHCKAHNVSTGGVKVEAPSVLKAMDIDYINAYPVGVLKAVLG